jgi:hypothetical protein
VTIKSTHKKITLDDLIIDPRVQRREGIDQRRVTKMVANFQPHALGSITVSQRDNGKMVVLDGMHRCSAVRQAKHDKPIQAHVLTGLSIQSEAELFNLLNNTKAPSAVTRFLTRVVMEEPTAVAMTEILAAHGWKVDVNPLPGCLAAVEALEKVYTSGGGTLSKGEHPELLDRVIELISAAWEHDTASVQGPMLLAVAQLLGRFGPSIDTKKLIAEMQATRPGVLIGKAKTLRDVQGGTVAAALAKILAGMHNKKRRSNLLPEWVWIR